MSDHFDRLLARHAPALRAVPGPPGAGGPDAGDPGAGEARPVRVRPRLAGPFERVEALRERSGEDDGLVEAPGARWPAPLPPRTDQDPGSRGLREIRTETRTVVRETPPAPRPEQPQPAQLRPESVSLRPAPARAPRPAAPAHAPRSTRAASAAGREDGSGTRPASSTPALVAPAEEAAARSAAARHGGDGLAAGRSARQQAAAARRGGARTRERVVHVQIGRLEVTAATPPGAGRGDPVRQSAGRAAPAVSLDDYLARGRTGERSN